MVSETERETQRERERLREGERERGREREGERDVKWTTFRALDHPILGPKFGPIPNAKKYVFFPIPDKKFPI